MGIIGKIFGAGSKSASPFDDNISKTGKLIGCDWRTADGPLDSTAVFDLYKHELDKGREEGYTPILLVPGGHLCEMIECNYNDNGGAAAFRKKMLNVDISDGKVFLEQRFDENMEMFDEDFEGEDVYGVFNEKAKPAKVFFSSESKDLMLVKVPVTEPWNVFAWLPFGGWNECPDTEDMIAVCKYWYEKYKAVPAVISSDELQMYVSAPVDSQEAALSLAEEQYAFCNDTVDQGTGTIKALASAIKDSNVWYFWWD